MSLYTLAEQSVERIQKRKGAIEGVTVPTQENVLSAIAKYIPVEVITIFLAGLSLLHPSPVVGWLTATRLFWTLLVFTPICLWMIFVATFRSQDPSKAWPKITEYPWWRIVASMVAFFVWAHAVPENGMASEDMVKVWSFLAVFVSAILTMLERVIEPKSQT